MSRTKIVHTRKKWIAKVLAVLSSVVAMMGTPSHANDGGVSLPQTGAEPVEVHLLSTTPNQAAHSDRLQVFVGASDTCCDGRTPMAGRYDLVDDTLTFSPTFGFEPGQDYVARLRTPGKADQLLPFQITSQASKVDAAVTEFFPSGNTLPENTLRFYIHFSTPMKPHVAFDYIKLRDASGNVDAAAFMQFKQELWNEDRTRLTVLIDPGRIKREVATNIELGPALTSGRQYTLSVEPDWPSADGASHLSAFSRTFTVTNALRQRPDVTLWRATSPCLGTKEQLSIILDRPFDRHLLSKGVRVVSSDGQSVEGAITVGHGEREWRFNPDTPWIDKELRIVVDAKLEDVAGNNFHDLLDHKEDATSDISTTEFPISLNRCS